MTVGMLSTAAVADGERTSSAVGTTVKLSAVTDADKANAEKLLKGVTITSLSDYMWRDEEVVPYFESTIKISNAGDWGKYKVLVKWEMKLPTEAETEWRYAGTDGVTSEPKPEEPSAYYVKQESGGHGPHHVTYVGVTRKMNFTSDTARKQIGNGMEHRCTVYVVKVNSDNTYEEIASKSTNAAKILLAVNYEKANYGWYSIGHGMDYGYYSTTEFVQGGTKADGTKKPAQHLYDVNKKYDFLGWYNGTEPYDFTKPVESIMTLTPEFGTVVSFDTKGIGDAIVPANVIAGQKLSAPTITNADDYKLIGWYKDAAFTQEYDFNKTIEANFPNKTDYKAVTLYAKLEKKITYLNVNLHLYYNGHGLGNVNQTITVVEGSTLAETCTANEAAYGKFLNPVCNGSHTFMGWFTDAAFKNSFDVNNTKFDKTITDLHALWGYEVTFNVGDHGAAAIKPQLVRVGGTVTQPDAPEATDDYTFIGWTFNGSAYNFSSAVNGKITLVANWKKNKQVIDLEKIENFTYDGKTHSVSIVDENGNALSGIESKNYTLTIKKDNATVTSIKDAGKYTVTLKLTEAGKQNYELKGNKTSIEVKFTVSPKVVESIIWSTETLVYNKTLQAPTATVSVFDGDSCTVTVSGQRISAGENYDATAESLSNKNYTIGTSTEKVTTKFSIEKQLLTVNWGDTKEFTYDNGNELKPTPEFTDVIQGDMDYLSWSTKVTKKNGTTTVSPTTVGEYTITVDSLSGLAGGNYQLPESTAFDFKIVAASGKIKLNVTGEKTVEYGTTFEVKVTEATSGGDVSFSSSNTGIATVTYNRTTKTAKVTAVAASGEATITAKVTKDGYTEATATIKVKVTPKAVELKWENLEQTYTGEEIKPKVSIITKITGLEACKVILSVEGFESGKYPTNYRQDGYKVTAALDNDKYVISGQNYRTLTIKKANSTVKLDQNTIRTVYGNPSFKPGYTVTGGTATLSSENNNVVTINNDGFIEIVHAGNTEVKVSVKGDNNHNDTSATIKVVIAPKPVGIEWHDLVIKYDGKDHCPYATVIAEDLVGEDKCEVIVGRKDGCSGIAIKTHHAQAKGLSNPDYTLKEEAKELKEFEIIDWVEAKSLEVGEDANTEYVIGVDEESIETLDLTQVYLVESYKSGSVVKTPLAGIEKGLTVSFNGELLGVQSVKVTYNNEEIGTFDITIRKALRASWSTSTLVYNGKAQAPEAQIEGVEDAGEIVTIYASEDAIDAILGDNDYYVVTAEINEDMLDQYVFENGTVVQEKQYKIVRKAVTITDWTADDATEWKFTDFLFWYDEKAHCPSPVLEGVLDKDGQIYSVEVADVAGIPSAVGYYTASVVIDNQNYYLKSGDSDTTLFAILKKVDAAEFTIRVPQCGETVELYRPAFDKLLSLLMSRPVKDIRSEEAIIAQTEDGVAAVPIIKIADETDYTWAVLANGIEGVTEGYGFLLPQVVVDKEAAEYVDMAYFNAIYQNMPSIDKEELSKTFTVEGDKVYTVVAVLAVNGEVATIDTAAIAKAIKVASEDEDVEVTIQHVIVSVAGVVVFADIHAVHNYTEFKVTEEPTEDTVGEKSRDCVYDGNVTHVDTAEIDKLIPESIEVIADGAKTDYLVNEELDVTNLKIKVTYTVGSTAEKPVTKDMVTNFDSSKVATDKAVTVEYKGLTADYKINVTKKQSSVKLSGDDTVTKVYGDESFTVELETENGTAVITSSDESVAKIVDGKVVIVGAGTATITATIAETDEVTGSEDSFELIVNKKVVGLNWTNLEFTEDGEEHVPTAEATGVLEGDSCTVTVVGGTAKAGEAKATATELSNSNYALPEDASVTFKINEKKTVEPKDPEPEKKGETEPEKKDEPEKVEPEKTEPEKTEPEKKDEVVEVVLIEIGDKVKRNYIVNDKIDLTDVTITVKTEEGTTQIPVTDDMVTGFDTSKPADNVEVTITYKGTSKQFNITVADLIYYTIEGNLAPASGENLVLVVHRSVHDELTFSLYLGTYIDGVQVPQTALKTWSGSLNMIMYAEYINTLSAGKHNIEIRFADGKAVGEITVTKVETNKKDDNQTEKNTPKTSDTSSLVLWIIILIAAALAFVATRVYANKRRSVE